MKKGKKDLSSTGDLVERIIATTEKETAKQLIDFIQNTTVLRAHASGSNPDPVVGDYACSGGEQCSGGVDSGTDSSCKNQTCPVLACTDHTCPNLLCVNVQIR